MIDKQILDDTNTAQTEDDILNDINATQTDTEIYKCPACGGAVEYNPEQKSLRCTYCGNSIQLSMNNFSKELDFSTLNSTEASWDNEAKVFKCTNCGAKSILLKTEIAKRCIYCGTSNVVETDELSGMKPNAVLPFLISAETATNKIVEWVKKRFFAPRKFKRTIEVENVHGNYTPAFTFDTNTVSGYRGRLGKHYTVTVGSGKNRRTETRIRWFNVSGVYEEGFNDVLVQASSDVDQKTVDKISPFNTDESLNYSTEYLHGFTATQYTKDGKCCWEEAKKIIYDRVKKGILDRYVYDVVDYLNVDMTCNDITYKYVLIPIYVGFSRYLNKIYNFFINGQSGKVTGKTPLSWVRIALVSLSAVAVVAGLVFLLYYFSLE